jgi:methylthioribose-1-phosphate isomerase
MEEVASSAINLVNMSEELQELITKFKGLEAFKAKRKTEAKRFSKKQVETSKTICS